MPIVVEAVEQTDYLIWSIIKEGMPYDVQISNESVSEFYYTNEEDLSIDSRCNNCVIIFHKAWNGVCVCAEGANDIRKLYRDLVYFQIYPSTAPTQLRDLEDPCTPEIRILLNAYGETLASDRNGYIYRRCYYCENIVLVRFEHFNYTQFHYWGYPRYVCHNAYSHRTTCILYGCYAMGAALFAANPLGTSYLIMLVVVPALLKM
jgi:hypothetical protein